MERETATAIENYASSLCRTADSLRRELYVFGAGLGGGAVREIHRHPVKAAAETGSAVVGGVVLGSLAAAELPIVSIGAIGAGAVLTGKYVFDLVGPSEHNRRRNAAISGAWSSTWKTESGAALRYQIDSLQDKCGQDSLHFLQGIAGGASCHIGASMPIVADTPGFAPASVLAGSESAGATGVSNLGALGTDWSCDDYLAFIKKHGPVIVKPLNEVSSALTESAPRSDSRLKRTEADHSAGGGDTHCNQPVDQTTAASSAQSQPKSPLPEPKMDDWCYELRSLFFQKPSR